MRLSATSIVFLWPFLHCHCSDPALYRTTVNCVLLKSLFQRAAIVFKPRAEHGFD